MTPCERVLAAFEGRAYDRVPTFHAGFSSRVASAIIGRPDAHVGGGVNQWREAVALWQGPEAHDEFVQRCFEDAIRLTEVLDLDLVRESYWRMPTKPTRRIDEYTFLYGDPDGAYEVYRYSPENELYQVIDQRPPQHELSVADIERAVERLEAAAERYAPTADSFSTAVRAREWFGGERAVRAGGVGINVPYRCQAWLEAVAARPDLVGRYLMAQAAHGEKACDAALAAGIRIMAGGGDFASQHGPFYSPTTYRELWGPAIRRVTNRCHLNGQFHKYASDGNLWPVADTLFPNVDGFYEIDGLAGMDLRTLRTRYPHLVCFGGVNSRTLHQCSPAEVVREVEAAMAVAHELGGVVVGCSNQVVAQTPMENFWAMHERIEQLRDG